MEKNNKPTTPATSAENRGATKPAFTKEDLAAARELVAEADGDPDKLLDLKELLADAIGGPEAKVGGEVVRVATFGEPEDKAPTIIKVDNAPDHWLTPQH